MSRRKKLSQADQAANEQAALNRIVDPNGAAEDAAIKGLMSPEFEKMSNLDASQIALMLQQIIRGEMSLIAQQNEIQIAQIRERQAQADREIAEQLSSQKKFIEDVLERAEKLQRSSDERDKLIAQGVHQYQELKQKAIANKVAKDLAFKQKLAAEPKVRVVSPGQIITTMENGQQVPKLIPEEIHVKGIHISIPIGQVVELPETLAKILDERRASQAETAQRVALLSRNLETTKLAQEWNKIGGSKTDAMPI